MAKKTFITNSKEAGTLKKRLYQLIEHSQELKFLVGFFYFSGWREITEALKSRDDLSVKILVGLQVDNMLGQSIEFAEEETARSNDDKAELFFESVKKAINCADMDIQELYEQVDLFVGLIEKGRLHIRKTLEPNHAKLYVFKIKEALKGIANSKFITGSSNLTRAGILGQNEFNVEIGDYGTQEAEEYFDELWKSAVPITEDDQRKKDLINIIRRKTQLAAVTPFEAYATVLKTYIETQEQKKLRPGVLRLLEEKGYENYLYQRDAVNQALTILDTYNGVIIADVVGLGKSIIASMIAKNTARRGLILCPPGLIGDKNATSGWLKYRSDFQLYDWDVRSSGDLENVADYMQEQGEDIEVVIVDEAHRFRNQDTANYELLSTICRNRQVVLLTATPFNNSPADIFSMLKLFIIPGKSKITLDDDLEMRFSHYSALFHRLSYILKNGKSIDSDKRKKAEKFYKDEFGGLPIQLNDVQARSKQLAQEIRAVLEPVLIRRNRIDLKNDPYYAKEISKLSEVEDPQELFYELTAGQSAFYDSVINDYFGEEGRFTGAIYQPFLYEKRRSEEKLDEAGNRTFMQQRNLYDFMRRLLVKRFESSFGSFNKSIGNFIRVHKCVLEFIKNSGGKYILDRQLIEKMYEKDAEVIENALDDFLVKLKDKKAPKHERIYKINEFECKDEFLANIKSDIVLLEKIQAEIKTLKLVDSDPKAAKLIKELKTAFRETPRAGEPVRKIIVFTEYVDTVKHLAPIVERAFPGKLLTVAGNLSASLSEDILKNYDASVKKTEQKDNSLILLTSDKLSEGVNLNRAGAVINYDIPWNPTRVIQRVGRMNRIGTKVFDKLRIYNAFPTEQGADIVKSRQIAEQKMYLIHNTLGEDSKIFHSDEIPAASELYKQINRNPEEFEDESPLTSIRREYYRIKKEYPDLFASIADFPHRIKTAKAFNESQLTVFRRKGLAFFVQHINDTSLEKSEISTVMFENSLENIKCDYEEPRLSLSKYFWKNYENIKGYKEVLRVPKSENALEIQAVNNLQSALKFYKSELEPFIPFIRTLIRDLREYRTLSKFTLRRLTCVDLSPDKKADIKKFRKELRVIFNRLGKNYLQIIKSRMGNVKSEVIIAIENIKTEN